MGRTHSNAYRRLNNFFPVEHKVVLKCICDVNEEKAKAFKETWGYERVETDWKKVMEADDIDMVDITVPNLYHKDIAIAAAKAGKIVGCEKPLAITVADAEEMAKAVEDAGVPNIAWFNYRRVPSISLAKQLIDEGRIGKPYHFRAVFLQDWTIAADVPQGGDALWRLDAKVAGSGVTGDLLAHNIDTAMWLNGAITRVVAKTETFVKERKHVETGKVEPVTIDDACMFLALFENGSMGTFESTRYARGHKALKTFELNGADGSVFFDLHEPEYLQFYEYTQKQSGKKTESHITGWRKIHTTNGKHPYMGHYWVPGLTIGYEHTFLNALADFVESIEKGTKFQPDFRNGVQTQKVCEAVLASAKDGTWKDTGVVL